MVVLCSVALEAEPAHVERFGVVLMMRLHVFLGATALTRLTDETAITKGIPDLLTRLVLEWVLLSPLALVLNTPLFSIRILGSTFIVGAVLLLLFLSVGSDVRSHAELAARNFATRVLVLGVELVEWLWFLALTTGDGVHKDTVARLGASVDLFRKVIRMEHPRPLRPGSAEVWQQRAGLEEPASTLERPPFVARPPAGSARHRR